MNQPEAQKRLSPGAVGLLVLIILVGLTIVEYFVATAVSRNLPIMIAMNVLDAALIMVYFMHLPRLWRRED
jgi:heme/copper-type cytochrome/quinol oxidase subunit 4